MNPTFPTGPHRAVGTTGAPHGDCGHGLAGCEIGIGGSDPVQDLPHTHPTDLTMPKKRPAPHAMPSPEINETGGQHSPSPWPPPGSGSCTTPTSSSPKVTATASHRPPRARE